MANSRPNQVQRILDYVAKHGSITQREADKFLGVQRLPSRISEMKKDYIITYQWETVKNRYGEKCRVKRDSIEFKSPVKYEMPYSAGMHGTVKVGAENA